MIEKTLFSHLSTNVSLVNGRVYPLIMPQDCIKPAITYMLVNENDKQSINNGAYGVKYRFQIDIYDVSYASIKEIKDQVKEALYDFVYFPHDLNVIERYEKDTKLYRQTIDFNIKG